MAFHSGLSVLETECVMAFASPRLRTRYCGEGSAVVLQARRSVGLGIDGLEFDDAVPSRGDRTYRIRRARSILGCEIAALWVKTWSALRSEGRTSNNVSRSRNATQCQQLARGENRGAARWRGEAARRRKTPVPSRWTP